MILTKNSSYFVENAKNIPKIASLKIEKELGVSKIPITKRVQNKKEFVCLYFTKLIYKDAKGTKYIRRSSKSAIEVKSDIDFDEYCS